MKIGKSGLVPAFCIAAWLAWAAAPAVDPKLYLDDVKYLASPELRGRASGSPELEKAAAFIRGKFEQFGLRPVSGQDYYQAFPVTTSAELGKRNRLTLSENGRTHTLRLREDYVPLHFSSSGNARGQVVFAGYGITAPELGYDDYAGMDVKGKLVLVLRHEPQEADDRSKFAGKRLTTHAQFASKASNAKMHGAAGVLLINDTPNHAGAPDELEKFGTAEGPADAGIPLVQVKEAAVDGWFQTAGKKLENVVNGIDRDLKPESFAFPTSIQVDEAVDVERLVKTVHNVAAYLPGETDEYVIFGAHYDHLGLGGQFSLAPSMTGAVHPGADDNASGTAGVIELARWFARQPKRKRGILFLTFAGEELGLLGSAYYAEHPELPLDRAVAMINMDMIGRIREGKVYAGGTSTGEGLRALVEKQAPASGLKIDFSEGPESTSSDHTSFVAKKVPALFFFSGLHADYHKPSDTWDKIDSQDAARLLDLIAGVADELRTEPGRPAFIRPAPAGHGGDAGPVSSSDTSGYGPYFGSVPDFGEGVKGVKFADVTAGSPAAQAGLAAGDVMVEFDGKPIDNLYDFTYALRARNAGDTVDVKVMRNGRAINVKVVLGRR